MTKDEFLTHLRSLGYEAENEKGCVVVHSQNMGTFEEIKAIAVAVGYCGSFGWRKSA